MFKKTFIATLALLTTFSHALANETDSETTNATQPNILMILIDDMGWKDVGVYGSKIYKTPHIDQLANEGVRFTQAYAAAHICSPTRASILTGQYPARSRITDWIPGHEKKGRKLLVPNWTKTIEAHDATIGEMLQQAGYTTAWLGKWHLRGGAKGMKYSDHKTSQSQQLHGFDAGTQDWQLNSGQRPDDPKGVFQLTDEAIAFIDNAGQKPWFVSLSHYSVHSPTRFNPDVKSNYQNAFNGTEHEPYAGYAAMVEPLDQSIGKIMAYLKQKNLDENTLVVFFSDNGGLQGKTNNAPLREGKGTLYEGGTRVPMIVRWLGKVPEGKVSDAITSSIDFFPTFAQLSKSNNIPEEVDGVSLLPHLVDNEAIERPAIYWHYPHYHKGNPGSAIRKGDYKLIEFFEDNSIELYNLKNDIGETKNLATLKPKLTQEMLGMLQNWRKNIGAQMMTINPFYSKK